MVVQIGEEKVRRKYFGFGPKIPTVELPDGTSTEEFQDWVVTFGWANPKRKKNQLTVPGLARDAIETDREGMLLYEALIGAVAPRILFDASYYWLQYQMPDAPFTINVDIDKPDQVLRAYDEFSAAIAKEPRDAKRIIRRIVPRSLLRNARTLPLFDTKPAKVVKSSLRTRSLMTGYLCKLYMEGAPQMAIEQFDEIMKYPLADLKPETYSRLPKHEKPDHPYLLEIKPKKKKTSLEERYVSGEIDLTEYSDLKFPERAEKRKKKEATYPLPEEKFTCVICCKPSRADIKCMECTHRACVSCVRNTFGEDEGSKAFVLLHHMYCLKLGRPIVRSVPGPIDHKAAHGRGRQAKDEAAAHGKTHPRSSSDDNNPMASSPTAKGPRGGS